MTPKEMHIAVEQGLQRVASYVFDDFLPEEIDLVLNKMQLRFIDDKFRKDRQSEGYEIQQGDLDDIQRLIEKDVELPAFLNLPSNNSYSILPANYLYLINDRTKIIRDCDTNNLRATEEYTEEHRTVFLFPDSANASSPYYEEFNIVFNGTTIFDINSYSLNTGLSSNEEKFVIKNLVLDEGKRGRIAEENIIGVYWERYRGRYFRNSFIIISTVEATQDTSITVDSNTTEVTSTPIENLEVSSLTPTKEVYNRLTKSEKLHEVLRDNVFHRTIPRSPISNLSEDRLTIYYNERFIATSIIIDYIRIPQLISLPLDRSCELDENTHERIVDLAVEFIKNTIEQPSYDTKVRDNLLRSE
jgi:hypothetical protein